MFEQIYNKVISDLENNLPSWLHYHSTAHTIYVLEQAIFLAKQENVSDRDLFLLKIAALYHDAGFMTNRKNHEKTGCRIAAEELPEFSLTSAEIQKICGMIMATRLPQKPTTHLEKILADADLEYLGTNRFKEISHQLYRETLHSQPDLSKQQWKEIEIKFLSNHHYHTDFCRKYREPKKQENLEQLRREV